MDPYTSAPLQYIDYINDGGLDWTWISQPLSSPDPHICPDLRRPCYSEPRVIGQTVELQVSARAL